MSNPSEIEHEAEFIKDIEELVNIGGWELADDDTLQWTSGTKDIFAVNDSFEPTLDSALAFFHPEDRPAIERAIRKCREEGAGYDIEVRIIADSEKTRWVRAIGDRPPGQQKIRGVIQDITDQKRRTQRLAVLNRALRHNLRNDLNVVQGYANQLYTELEQLDLLRGEDGIDLLGTTVELRDASHVSSEDLQTLSHIIEEIEEFSIAQARGYAATVEETSRDLIELGRKANAFAEWVDQDPVRGPIALTQLIENTLASLQEEYPDASITTIHRTDSYVEADTAGLRLVIEEAIRNAIEHNDAEHPDVIVTTSNRKGRVQLDVIDNGPGIPDVQVQVLSQREETPLSHSSGIGLWVMNWIITHYGGDIEFWPNEPRGTIMIIKLPTSDMADEA